MPTKHKRARVRIGTDEQGKAVYKWASAPTKKALKEEMKRIEAESAAAPAPLALPPPAIPAPPEPVAPPPPAQSMPTFREYASNWFELYKKPKIEVLTIDMYNNVFETHLYPEFGDMPINAISADQLQAFLNRYEGRSDSLISKILMTIRLVFNAALDDELIPRSVTKRLIKPEGTIGERIPLSMSEVAAATSAARGHKWGLLPILLIYSGLRREEAVGLRWCDIYDDYLHIRQAVVYRGNSAPIIKDLKNDSSERDISILPEIAVKLGAPDTGYVFHGRRKDIPICFSTFTDHWEALKEDIPALHEACPHRLRHTFLMLLRRAGVDPATQQYLMGHADYETTANTYTHIDGADIEEACGLLAKMLPVLLPISHQLEKTSS